MWLGKRALPPFRIYKTQFGMWSNIFSFFGVWKWHWTVWERVWPTLNSDHWPFLQFWFYCFTNDLSCSLLPLLDWCPRILASFGRRRIFLKTIARSNPHSIHVLPILMKFYINLAQNWASIGVLATFRSRIREEGWWQPLKRFTRSSHHSIHVLPIFQNFDVNLGKICLYCCPGYL